MLNINYPYSVSISRIILDYPQYDIVKSYIRWQPNQYVKDGYDNIDMKLDWYVGRYKIGCEANKLDRIETLFYVEALIFLFNNISSHDHYYIACLKLYNRYVLSEVQNQIDINIITNLIEKSYNYVMDNKDEILKYDRTWKPLNYIKKVDKIKKVYRNIPKNEFIAILDDCKELTGKRTYTMCMNYFKTNTGLSNRLFANYIKQYNIVFDEKEKSYGQGRPKAYWPNSIQPNEWKLSIQEIYDIVKVRHKELTVTLSQVKNWKYKKLREMKANQSASIDK